MRRLLKYIAIAFGLVLVYQILLFPGTVRYLTKSILEGATRAKIDLEVERSSLVYGFDIRNIKLRSENGDPILTAARLRLSWFLPGFLAGHIGLRQLGLYDATIYATEKGGVWNLNSLSSGKEKKPEEKKKAVPREPREAIRTYLPIKLYGDIRLDNVSVIYSSETAGQAANIQGIDFRLAFITKTFTSIPLNTDALDLFQTLVVAVNPYGPIHIQYSNGNKINGDLNLSFRLFRQNESGSGVFSSILDLDTSDLTLERFGYAPVQPTLVAHYHTSYDQKEDALLFRNFELGYGGRQWLEFRARVEQLQSGKPRMELSVLRSEINLNEPGQFLSLLTNGRIRLGGYLSLYPFVLRGPLENLEFDAVLDGRNLTFATTTLHSVPSLTLKASGGINLFETLPFLRPPEDYNSEEAKKNLAYGMIHKLDLQELSGGYNGATLLAQGSIRPEEGVNAQVRLNSFNLGQFLSPYLTGLAGADLTAHSTESFDDLAVEGTVTLAGGRYAIGRSRSGINNLSLYTSGQILLKKEFTRIEVERLTLQGRSEAGLPFLNLAGNATLEFAEGKQSYDATVASLSLEYAPLMTTLPARLRYPIAPYGAYLREGLQLHANASIRSEKENTSINSNGNITVPAISQDPLQLTVDTNISPGNLGIPLVQISGLRGALHTTLTGHLNTSGDLQPYLQFRMSLARDQMLPVHENVSIQGNVNVNLDINPQIARGGIYIKDLDIQVNTGDCSVIDSPACKRLRIEKLNLSLPIEHSMALKDPVRLSETSSGLALTDTGFRQSPNLTVRFMASSHTPGGTFKPESYFYLGSLDPSKGYGLSARIDYRRNVFMIDWIDARIYKPKDAKTGELWVPDGTIQGRRIFFNAANLAPANMEYAGFLQLHNLNLAPFFPDSDSTFDGIVSGDLSITGRDLSDPIRNTNLRLSVYRISEEFTGFAVRLLLPSDVLAYAVNNTLKIPAIQVELKGGLIYTSVKVERPTGLSLSLLVRPSEEEIRQERIPLAEFLERARSESSRFARETSTAQE
ncbi:MAG: hypothetical protein KDK33_08935 [Leptospiraceae bacterium]|nr:hypothetical protein [Leptospiraceae bacterium]